MRPELMKVIHVDCFREYYWLKEELQTFCRANGISATGSKQELADRIEHFLLTGEIKKPKVIKKGNAPVEMSLDTIITENHRCSQQVRAFFKTMIPTFHFSTFIQNYFKNNVGKTYGDAHNAWYEEEERKKDPSYTKNIAPQFEYNQFTRDYFADPNNQSKTRQDAIDAWHDIKKLPGSNQYRPSK